MPEELKGISRFHSSHENDSLEALMKYRIIVVTLVSAGKLASLGFPSDHFSHLFIDEAGKDNTIFKLFINFCRKNGLLTLLKLWKSEV